MKGVSTVIVVILLLLITIAFVGYAYIFFTRATSTATDIGTSQIGITNQQVASKFVIENVNANKIYIRNIGSQVLQASTLAVFLDEQPVTATVSDISPNLVGTITIDDSFLPSSPTEKTVKVTSIGWIKEVIGNVYSSIATLIQFVSPTPVNGATGVTNPVTINMTTNIDNYNFTLSLDGTRYVLPSNLSCNFEDTLNCDQGKFGVMNSGPALFESGKFGKGIDINKSTGYLTYSNTDNIDHPQGTIMFWVKPDPPGWKWEDENPLIDTKALAPLPERGFGYTKLQAIT